MEFGLYECVLKSVYRYIKYARHRDTILLHGRQRFQQTLRHFNRLFTIMLRLLCLFKYYVFLNITPIGKAKAIVYYNNDDKNNNRNSDSI